MTASERFGSNAKAISSDDYQKTASPVADRSRINQFANANSLSSEQYFDRVEPNFKRGQIRPDEIAGRLGKAAVAGVNDVADRVASFLQDWNYESRY